MSLLHSFSKETLNRHVYCFLIAYIDGTIKIFHQLCLTKIKVNKLLIVEICEETHEMTYDSI